MLSRRWRARLGVLAAIALGSLSIASLAARSVQDRQLLRAHAPARMPTPARVSQIASPARAPDTPPPEFFRPDAIPAEVSVVAQSLPRPSPAR